MLRFMTMRLGGTLLALLVASMIIFGRTYRCLASPLQAHGFRAVGLSDPGLIVGKLGYFHPAAVILDHWQVPGADFFSSKIAAELAPGPTFIRWLSNDRRGRYARVWRHEFGFGSFKL